MDFSFSLVIPSRGNISNITSLINSINSQTYRPQKVYIILDKIFSKDDFDVLSYFVLKNIDEDYKNSVVLISNVTAEFNPGQGVSYVRNYGIDLVTTKYLYIIDDDNVFENDFFEQTFENRLDIKESYSKDFLISPTIIYRKTELVQSQGMKEFNYMVPKVVPNRIGIRNYSSIRMIGGNSLFGPSYIFQRVRFDERFEFVYEDLDFSYRVSKDYSLFVIKNLKINHMEREKNILEKSFIGDEKGAYQKARNRIRFVKKNATTSNKIKFFAVGLWIQTIWFLYLIWKNGNDKNPLYKAIINGTIDGIKY